MELGSNGAGTDYFSHQRIDLRESTEDCPHLLVESVHDYGSFRLGPDGRVATWTAGAQRLNGYEAQEIFGQGVACFYGPEDVRDGKPTRDLAIAQSTGRFE